MSFQVFTNIGNKRENNEDSYLVLQIEKEDYILAVADGMGGHNAGEVASKIAIKSLKEYPFNLTDNITQQLKSAIINANENIFKYSENKKEYKEMGTTLTTSVIKNDYLYFGHVGDSRIYIYDNNLHQITTDHSLVNDLIENKTIKPDEAFDHPNKNIITQALGIDKDLKIQTDKVKLDKGNIIMLCTDGLTDMIRIDKMEKIFRENKNIDNILNNLGSKALENGGQDNITIIMGKI